MINMLFTETTELHSITVAASLGSSFINHENISLNSDLTLVS